MDADAPIVVGVDGSDHTDRALRWAIREAELRRVSVTLVHAYAEAGATTASVAGTRELARRVVADVVARHRHLLDGISGCDTVLRPAPAATALLDAARHGQLLVVGSRGLGEVREVLLGSTSHRVLLHAAVPVALVPTPRRGAEVTAEEHDGLRPIVVGVDPSPESSGALRWAVDEACRRDVGVLAVHGVDLPTAASLRSLGLPVELVTQRLADTRAAARERIDALLHGARPVVGDVHLDRVIDDAAPIDALLRYATAEHLLVVGTRGRRGFAEMTPGSVSHRCAHHAAGPMVAVPHRP